jgi:hypothetical protein
MTIKETSAFATITRFDDDVVWHPEKAPCGHSNSVTFPAVIGGLMGRTACLSYTPSYPVALSQDM